MEMTTSPSLFQTAYQDGTPQTDQEWADVLELLVQAATQSSRLLPIDARLAPAVIATGDGGAMLVNSALGTRYLGTYLYLRRLRMLVGRPAPVSLQSARIVDSTIKEIRQPHLDAIQWMKQATGFSQERIAELVGVSRQTLNRWQRGEHIKDTNRQRIFAVRSVLERALIRHRTRAELVEWLDTPRGADGRTPAQCLADGAIDRARLLAVSTPSTQLKRAPSWVRQPVPDAFRAGAEHEQEALPPELPDEPEWDVAAAEETPGER